MPTTLAEWMTAFGNIGIAGPVLLVALLWLWRSRLRPLAWVLGASCLCAIAATILLKLVSGRVGGAFFGTAYHLTTGAPSGHAALSAVVYGGIGALFGLRGRGLARVLGVTCAVLLIAGVAITRVLLHSHSPADVLTGLLLGGTFAAMTFAVTARTRRNWPSMLPLLFALVAVAGLMHVTHLRWSSTEIL